MMNTEAMLLFLGVFGLAVLSANGQVPAFGELSSYYKICRAGIGEPGCVAELSSAYQGLIASSFEDLIAADSVTGFTAASSAEMPPSVARLSAAIIAGGGTETVPDECSHLYAGAVTGDGHPFVLKVAMMDCMLTSVIGAPKVVTTADEISGSTGILSFEDCSGDPSVDLWDGSACLEACQWDVCTTINFWAD